MGVALKSYRPFICSHADSLGLIRDPRIKFSVSSACGNVLSHRCMGNWVSMDHHPAAKWFLAVRIARSAALVR